jgi:hypothetical protein
MPLSKYPAQTFKFVQSTPATRWLISHGAAGYPIIDVYVNDSGVFQKLLPNEVNYIDEFTTEVLLTNPQSGYAMVTV